MPTKEEATPEESAKQAKLTEVREMDPATLDTEVRKATAVVRTVDAPHSGTIAALGFHEASDGEIITALRNYGLGI